MPKSRTSKDLASKIFSRAIHFVITLGVFAVLVSTDTVLRIQIKNGDVILPSTFIIATFVSLVLYCIVSFMDPGYVKKSDPDVKEISLVLDDCDNEVELFEVKTSLRGERNDNTSSSDDERQSMLTKGTAEHESSQAVRFNLEPNQRCGFCGLERPLRARHCRECKHCVRKFDHHCPWVANCVGEKNHKWFWIFLTFETLLISWCIYISTTGYRSSGSSKDWLNHNVLLLLVDIILVIFLFIAGSMCTIHTYMVLSNHTTWESMSRHRITYLNQIAIDNPFNMGSCKNIYVFFCYCKPFDWHAVYDLKVSKTQFSGTHNKNCSANDEEEEVRNDTHL